MSRSFGKRKNKFLSADHNDQAAQTSGNDRSGIVSGGGGDAQRPSRVFPWDGKPDYAACNYALVHLVGNLQKRLTVEGRLHAGSLLAAIGAIAGYAAQCELLRNAALTVAGGTLDKIQTMQTENGNTYIFGEPLNQMLISTTDADADGRLWPLAGGAAVAAGLPQARLPRVEDMFAHVTRSIGTVSEGLPSVPSEHHPGLPAGDLLQFTWPLAHMCFSGKIPGAPREFGVADSQHHPAIAARAANTLIQQVKGVLELDVAVTIVVESGIYASKLAPGFIKAPASPDNM